MVSGVVNVHDVLSHNSDATSRHYWADQSSSQCWDSSTHCSFPQCLFHTPFAPQPQWSQLHTRGFAITDRQVSTGWNKRLTLFRHPSWGSDKGQQVCDAPSRGVWEAAFPLRQDPWERRSSPEVVLSQIANAAGWNRSNLTAELTTVAALGSPPTRGR